MEPDKNNSIVPSSKKTEIVSFFEEYSDFVFIFKKTEKLSAAIYMVTGLLSDSEPLKWTLRKKVSELLSYNHSYKDIKDTNLVDFVFNERSKILEIVSHLEVASKVGLVSEMNFSILKQEFSNLSDVFNFPNSEHKSYHGNSIDRSFFTMDSEKSAYIIETSQKTQNVSVKDNNPVKDRSILKRSNRQNIILSLLKKKKEVTIKDISLVIKDCSEKTIQRELISFIKAGILKRSGERRWSKYSLA